MPSTGLAAAHKLSGSPDNSVQNLNAKGRVQTVRARGLQRRERWKGACRGGGVLGLEGGGGRGLRLGQALGSQRHREGRAARAGDWGCKNRPHDLQWDSAQPPSAQSGCHGQVEGKL